MVSLVITIGKSHQKRDALLKDIANQNFPSQALQVVLASSYPEAFQDLPEVAFDVRTVLVKDRRFRPAMIDIAFRQCSGDFFFVLDEDAIFDNPNDLLKLYEFLLEHQSVDVCMGYNIEHHMIEPRGGESRILKSQVLEMDGFSNICLRRKVMESGFSFSRFLFADTVPEELQAMGFQIDKLKWLQIHHKKSVPFYMVGLLRIWEEIVVRYQKIVEWPPLSQAQSWVMSVYRSERWQRLNIRFRWWIQDAAMFILKYSRLFWQLSKVQLLRFKVFVVYASRRIWVALRHQYQLRMTQSKHRLKQLRASQIKIYVPHLESDDQAPRDVTPKNLDNPMVVKDATKESKKSSTSKPLFRLKSSENPTSKDL